MGHTSEVEALTGTLDARARRPKYAQDGSRQSSAEDYQPFDTNLPMASCEFRSILSVIGRPIST